MLYARLCFFNPQLPLKEKAKEKDKQGDEALVDLSAAVFICIFFLGQSQRRQGSEALLTKSKEQGEGLGLEVEKKKKSSKRQKAANQWPSFGPQAKEMKAGGR
jgi:hypothetical protein